MEGLALCAARPCVALPTLQTILVCTMATPFPRVVFVRATRRLYTCNKSALQGAAASEGLLSQAAVFEISNDDVFLALRRSRTISSSRSGLELSLSRRVNGYFSEFCAATNFLKYFPSPCLKTVAPAAAHERATSLYTPQGAAAFQVRRKNIGKAFGRTWI